MIRLAVFDLDGTLTEMAGWYRGRIVEQLCACLHRVTLAARRIVG